MDSRQQKNLAFLGAAATMAGAAAAYLYMGKGAPERRKKVATWYRSAEREIVSEASKLKNAAFNEENYQRIIDVVARRYEQARNISPEEISRFVSLMREGWERAGRALSRTDEAGSARKGAQKAAIRTSKKRVRKAKTARSGTSE